jgi:hypothetical protein
MAGQPVEQVAVGDRLAVPGHGEAAVPAEEHVARLLAGHVAAGDVGAVRRFVNELEHGLGPWHVNPWRLVEHLANVAMRLRARGGN